MRAGRVSLLIAMLFVEMSASAGGPRFVTGTANGQPAVVEAFYTSQVTYFTDAGALASTVNHAQADAMVAAAAAVWNVPTASVTLSQGGVLTEHVSGANAYFDGTEMQFPPDVMATNYLRVPIAVIYDTDGSVTDLLLGEGASAPGGCRQHGVTESVDAFGANGAIDHAVIVLNGRCVGGNAQQLMQMQYQTMRAFGRVLGLAWSQVNDNVFTGSPTPTVGQMAHWPVMHPIDVVCGLYTYQCMQNAFTLRPDDLSSLALLYPVTAANATAGKVPSNTNAIAMQGWTSFSNGQGMELLNMTVTRAPANNYGWELWETVSGVAGVLFQQNAGNPVSGPETAAENVGAPYGVFEGEYLIGMVPVDAPYTGLLIRPEAINPLYTGEYAVGPYQRVPESVAVTQANAISPYAQAGPGEDFWITMSDEPDGCNPGNDGTEASPVVPDASGWWTGLLCGVGHSSWASVAVKAGRTWTLETTALDESGSATTAKAQPVLGVWNATDPTGTLPTVAGQAVAMNAMALGVTQLRMAATATDGNYRFVVSDQFGAGRPDFAYKARLLCVDGVSPAVVPPSGGQITLVGRGFRQGDQVLVNGVVAQVVSWTATQIVANVPTQSAAGAGSAAVDVAVRDETTGAMSDVAAALSYSGTVVMVGPAAQVSVVSGAGQSVHVGATLAPVALQVSDANGNAVSGATVSVYQTVYAWEGACAATGPCASAPVLKTSQATMVSGVGGAVSVTPLQVSGQPQTVEIGVAVGTAGFVSVGLVVGP
jgi:hypothetical protein